MRVLNNTTTQTVSGGVTFAYSDPDETIVGWTAQTVTSGGTVNTTLMYAFGLGTGQLYYYNEAYITSNSIPTFESFMATYYQRTDAYSGVAQYLP